jgi:hypothetical protein
MARQIDPDKPLSAEDRQWLEDWSRYEQIRLHDEAHPPEDGGSTDAQADALFDNLKPLQSGSDATGEQEEEEDPLKGESATFTNLSAPEDDSDGDDEGDWYEDEGVTNDDLRDELGKRELSKSGNKEELIARLREDDASDE